MRAMITAPAAPSAAPAQFWHWLGAMLLVLLPLAPAQATLSCPPPRPTIEVTTALDPPRIDNSLSQPALRQRAGRGHPLGLYVAEVEVRWSIAIARLDGGSEACRWIAKVEVAITARSRVIYVLRERQPGTCAYASVMTHERQHQATDDAVIEEYRSRIQDATAAAVSSLPIGPFAVGDAAVAEKRLTRPVSAAIEREFKALKREREARQKAVDTPEEYRRIAAACG
jgi:hypothetical protein